MAMEVVVEIGVGARGCEERPCARQATRIGVDVDVELLQRGGSQVSLAADGAWLPLRSGLVDMVVARNVFGDVGLGHAFEEVTGASPEEYAERVRRLASSGSVGEMLQLRDRIRDMVASVERLRELILLDSLRVLRPGGFILVVETMTPLAAQEWIHRVCDGRVKNEGTGIVGDRSVRVRSVRSHARRTRYCLADELADPAALVWLIDGVGSNVPRL